MRQTAIDGLLAVNSPVHADDRGRFGEAWQREKMVAAGLPDFGPVQQNVAVSRLGVTRGIHAEPWDKLVTVATGRAHGVWVDLRRGPSFGRTVEIELVPGTSVYVPRGVGNAYQVLADDTAYVYLVNDHWHSDAVYVGVHPGDPTLGLSWPVPLDRAVLSEKDRAQPLLGAITPFERRRTAVLGAGGKVGRALMAIIPGAYAVDRERLDLADLDAVERFAWSDFDVVINAAAHTAVDAAETPEGRRVAWAVNAEAPARIAGLTAARGTTLVHYSTDYVYDGTREPHSEGELLAPLSAYGQSKAAGDLAVGRHPRHYLLRTSWVVGDDPATSADFVSTMRRLAVGGASPAVVDDQIGRLTFAGELARATTHLLQVGAPWGTYHVTNGGPATSWADVARHVFALCGRDPDDVERVSTSEYGRGKGLATRPTRSVLDLTRMESTGWRPEDARVALERVLSQGA